jgi:hypothetical protein
VTVAEVGAAIASFASLPASSAARHPISATTDRLHARGDGSFVPAAYLHLWTQETIGLVGGAPPTGT